MVRAVFFCVPKEISQKQITSQKSGTFANITVCRYIGVAMRLKEILEERGMSVYRLAKTSGVPYATCSDLVREKTKLSEAKAETVYRIAGALNMKMENLLAPSLEKRPRFSNFCSEMCHRLKKFGDLSFINKVDREQWISDYYEMGWYEEALYLLAMIDYLCRVNSLPLREGYEELRKTKLSKPVYAIGTITFSKIYGNDEPYRKAEENAIPEFKRFNIMEGEIRDAV